MPDSAIDPAVTLQTSVEDFVAASKAPAKSRLQGISSLVTPIAEYAYERGLPSPLIEQLLQALTSKSTVDQSTTTLLIRNLFPAEIVPSRCVLHIVSSLGIGEAKAPLATQSLLLRWLCNVYTVLEEPGILARLYGTLWNLLDVMGIRGPLCQLLALTTRRRHVKPFRIQQLMRLSGAVQPEMRILCDVYKTYCPDLSFGTNRSARTTATAKSDAAWRARLVDVQMKQTGFISHTDNNIAANGHGAKQKFHLVPRTRTQIAAAGSVAVEDIVDAAELVATLELVELPAQIAAAMNSELLQLYLQLCPSTAATLRLEFWLAQCLDDMLVPDAMECSAEMRTETLFTVLQYVKSLRHMPSIIESFLLKYVTNWDGISDVALMLELLSYVPGDDFRVAHSSCLGNLEAQVGRHNADSLEVLTSFYSGLLHRRVLRLALSQRLEEAAFIRDLQTHITTLHLSALVSLSEGSATISSIVRYYEGLSQLSQTAAASPIGSAAVLLPLPQIVFLMAFNVQLDALSRLCTMLTAYKGAFEAGIRASIKWPVEFTNRFNGYLMDVCNLLWRSRALTVTDPNSMGCLCPEPTAAALRGYLVAIDREYALASFFGFSHNVLACNASVKALQCVEAKQRVEGRTDLVEHVGPVSQRTLTALEREGGARLSWKDYRVACLQWLDDRAVSGIRDLMQVTMKDLMRS